MSIRQGRDATRERLGSGGLGAALVATAALALALALAGCGGDDSSDGAGGAASGPKTITVGTLPIANAAPMYLGAALLTEPFLSAMLARGGTQIGAPSVETLPSFPTGVYMAASKYIQANRDVVDRFSRAMNTSLDDAQNHPDEVRKIIPTFTKTPAAAAAKLRLPALDSKLDRKGIELEAHLTAKYGIIDKASAYPARFRSGATPSVRRWTPCSSTVTAPLAIT